MKIYLIYKEWFYVDSDNTERACAMDDYDIQLFKTKRDALQYIEQSKKWDLKNNKVIVNCNNESYASQGLIHGTPFKKVTRLIEKELIK